MITRDLAKKFIKWCAIIYFIGFFIYQFGSIPSCGHNNTDWDETKVPWIMNYEYVSGIEIGRPGYQDEKCYAFIIKENERGFAFERHFYSDRGNRTGTFNWDKVNGQKEGSWCQEYPFDHGRWQLDGNKETGFYGWLTNKDNQKMKFLLRAKR